jgi:hypothetical protein
VENPQGISARKTTIILGFDPLKVKVRENPAWVALGGEVPSLTIPFQQLKRY